MDTPGRRGGLRFGTHRVSIPVPRRATASSPPDGSAEGSTERLPHEPALGDATIQDVSAPVFDAPIAPAQRPLYDEVDDRLATIPLSCRALVDQSGVTATGPEPVAPTTADWAPPAPRVRVPAPRGATVSAPFPAAPAAPSPQPAHISETEPPREPTLLFIAAAVVVGALVGVAATLWLVR